MLKNAYVRKKVLSVKKLIGNNIHENLMNLRFMKTILWVNSRSTLIANRTFTENILLAQVL